MNDTTTFEQLAASKPPPVVPFGEASLLFKLATVADAKGDTAARTYWLEEFQSRLEDNQS